MGLNITCDRCGKNINMEDRINLVVNNPRNDGTRVLLNQQIYLCKEHMKEFPNIINRFMSTYMTNKKT
jgi:hypothetical protein